MRIGATVKPAVFAVLWIASVAHAHPQTSYNLTADGQGLYYWQLQGVTGIFQETNGRATDGTFANRAGTTERVYTDAESQSINPSGNAVLGLQLHNVCYGTFKPVTMKSDGSGCVVNPDPALYPTPSDWPAGPDCLNWHHQACLVSYLPWGYFVAGRYVDGSRAACEKAGGNFVPKDTLVAGQYSDLTAHIPNQPLTQCFPPCYGTASYDPTTQGCKP